MFRRTFHSIKRTISKFKLSNIKKRKEVWKKLKPHFLEIKNQLLERGFSKIKPYSLKTWKNYQNDHIRLTITCLKDGEKKLVKCGKGFDNKISNSIRFQNLFNDVFDFIPKGDEITLNGYKSYMTDFIDSVPFTQYTRYASIEDIKNLISQANKILDELNKYKIVHCDLESINILVQKRTNRLYLIDFDTCCSKKYGLCCRPDSFPDYTIKQRSVDRIVYDDAYSFFVLFVRLNNARVNALAEFAFLKNKIGRNTHETPIVKH